MKKKIVGLDLDDVLMDFNHSACTFHNKKYGTSYKRENITSFFIKDLWEAPKEEVFKRVNDFYNSEEHTTALPVDGAVSTIDSLRSSIDFAIITSRPETAKHTTTAWVEKHFPYLVDKIHFTDHFVADKKAPKSEVCKKLGVEVFIDDGTLHIEDVAPIVKHALLFDTPWNCADDLTHKNIKRVFSWNEIKDFLL